MRDIRVGGLTPSLPLVRAIADETALPLRVIVRENAGYGADAAEMARMCGAAESFAALPVDGLVIGFARDGELLLDELREILRAAPALPATFHRAFDALADPLRAIDRLAEVPQIDRILTDGRMAARKGPPYEPDPPGHEGAADNRDAPRRCARLREYSDRAGPRLTIIAGGGVHEALVRGIAHTRCVREVHVGRAARDGNDPDGPVTAARVQRLREILTGRRF